MSFFINVTMQTAAVCTNGDEEMQTNGPLLWDKIKRETHYNAQSGSVLLCRLAASKRSAGCLHGVCREIPVPAFCTWGKRGIRVIIAGPKTVRGDNAVGIPHFMR